MNDSQKMVMPSDRPKPGSGGGAAQGDRAGITTGCGSEVEVETRCEGIPLGLRADPGRAACCRR